MDDLGRFIAGVEITDDLIGELLTDHAPEYNALEVGRYYLNVEVHLTVRLGDTHAIRFYRSARDSERDAQSLTWLKAHAHQWDFASQVPLLVGPPDSRVPWGWEIVPWLDGTIAVRAGLAKQGIVDLARALHQIHQLPPAHAPPNPRTRVPLSALATYFETTLDQVVAAHENAGNVINRAVAQKIWTAAVDAAHDVTPTWTHGKLDPRFVISTAGAFGGIIYWKDYGVGDPAYDLGSAALIAGSEHIDSFLAVYSPHISDETVTRGRGLLLLNALVHSTSTDSLLANLAEDRLRELHILD